MFNYFSFIFIISVFFFFIYKKFISINSKDFEKFTIFKILKKYEFLKPSLSLISLKERNIKTENYVEDGDEEIIKQNSTNFTFLNQKTNLILKSKSFVFQVSDFQGKIQFKDIIGCKINKNSRESTSYKSINFSNIENAFNAISNQDQNISNDNETNKIQFIIYYGNINTEKLTQERIMFDEENNKSKKLKETLQHHRKEISHDSMIQNNFKIFKLIFEIDENLENIAIEWNEQLNQLLNQKINNNYTADGMDKKRHFLFIVNPYSGTKKAKQTFETVIKYFEIANIKTTLIETQSVGHAEKILKEMPYEKILIENNESGDSRIIDSPSVKYIFPYDAVICVSGDGIVHEAINGLLSRENGLELAKFLPFGLIPSGSGNGLALSLSVTKNILYASFRIIKSLKPSPMDVFSISQIDENKVETFSRYCLLLACFGFISDCDFESEKFRWMGDARFFIQSVIRIIRLRFYPLVIKIKRPIGSFTHNSNYQDKEEITIDSKFSLLLSCNANYISDGALVSPNSKLADGLIDLILVQTCSKWNVLNIVLNVDTGKYVDFDFVQSFKASEFSFKCDLEKTRNNVNKNAYFDVDGERFPIDKEIKVKCIKGVCMYQI